MSDELCKGNIFNIQSYSVHDGPGIRTVVFLKGCPLRCQWCSNPESQRVVPELAYNEAKCIGTDKCCRCIEACPHAAISASATTGKIDIRRDMCEHCVELCTTACVAQSLINYGHSTSVKEVMKTVEKDMPFYARSGGGITLSGGEPLMQKDFALALLREAKKRRIKTNIETCGYVPEATLLAAAGLLNHAIYDIKHIDAATHKMGTGVDNALILSNFSALVELFPALPIVVRTPVIPGFNDSEECISAIASLVKEKQAINPKISYELLPYHRLGTQKYTFLGWDNPLGDQHLDTSVFTLLQKRAASILQP